MSDQAFQLRSVTKCHSMDVRAVSAVPNQNSFVTGSRDKSAKLYEFNDDNKLVEKIIYTGSTHYVSSVHVQLNQSGALVYLGSNDTKIYVFDINSADPLHILSGHKSTVCCLNGEPNDDRILSGSWDKSAIIWKQEQAVITLQGHTAAVWCGSIFSEDIVLTGSADKSIKLWLIYNGQATCSNTFLKHTDCVRDLKKVCNDQFISCGNDAIILHWNIAGEVLATYDGHENYIYSLTVLNKPSPNDKLRFASCSEDKTVRVWSDGKNEQIIRIPAPTLWSVTNLINGDLVVGASNGNVYVFTREQSLMASQAEQLAYEQDIANSTLPMAELGDINVKQLPDKNALNQPGTKNGQTKLIREGKTIHAFQWDALKNEWCKVGEVVGSANPDHDPSSKKEFEGKLYDFVFSVDIEDGAPALKLPYNLDQNPWTVAQEFIHKHELSQGYLEQVANFIVKNTQAATGASVSATPSAAGSNFDPLTGGSSYSTASKAVNKGISKKLKEFSRKVSPNDYQLQFEDLDILFKLKDANEVERIQQIQIIRSLLQWPKEFIFPALDLLKAYLLVPELNNSFSTGEESGTLIEFLLHLLTDSKYTPNQFLSMRSFCNMFSQSPGEKLMRTYMQLVLNSLTSVTEVENKNVQASLAALLLNYSVLLCKKPEDMELKTDLLFKIIPLIKLDQDEDTQFRLMTAAGTLLTQNRPLLQLINSQDIATQLRPIEERSQSRDNRNRICATSLIQLTR